MKTARRHNSILIGAMVWLALTAASAGAGETVGQGYPLRSASAANVAAPAATPSVSDPASPAQPGIAAAGGDFENQRLNFPASRRAVRPDGSRDGGYVMPSIWPALFCVALVCAVFIGILYLVKKYLPGHRQLFSHPAVEVLGRTHIDPRRYVSLLRVGKRIIVVGVSPDEMRSLSEITDEAEITGILEVARPKTEAGLSIFQRLFQRHVVNTEAAENRAVAHEKALEIEEQMSSLRERVRAIRGSEESTRRTDARHVDAIG